MNLRNQDLAWENDKGLPTMIIQDKSEPFDYL